SRSRLPVLVKGPQDKGSWHPWKAASSLGSREPLRGHHIYRSDIGFEFAVGAFCAKILRFAACLGLAAIPSLPLLKVPRHRSAASSRRRGWERRWCWSVHWRWNKARRSSARSWLLAASQVVPPLPPASPRPVAHLPPR